MQTQERPKLAPAQYRNHRNKKWFLSGLLLLILLIIGVVSLLSVGQPPIPPTTSTTTTNADCENGGNIPTALYRGDEGKSQIEDIMRLKPGEGAVDRTTGFTKDGVRGPSFNADPTAIRKFPKLGIARKVTSISKRLQFQRTSEAGDHYELIPVCPMTQNEYQSYLNETLCE